MKSIACSISYGSSKIDYELLMTKRKSIEIAVHPDKSVVVKAPLSACLSTIAERVEKRARWIKSQIAYFTQFDPRTPERRYIDGESHCYLGRKYRLKIENSDQDKVLLKNGYFYVQCKKGNSADVKTLLEAWYRQRAKIHLTEIFESCWDDFSEEDLDKPSLKLQKMKKRWGSLSHLGRLTLNINLIQVPRVCIEYVIVHELCHLVHYNHSSDYYKLLDCTMDDWIKRKHKLELALV